jgi:phosphoglycerate dehydrogenase-like enzyme
LVNSLAEICERADALTVHVPLIDDTREFIGADELRLLGPEGLLVNASRGGVVDQEALLTALQGGVLGAAAIDCFEPEPADMRFVQALEATGRVVMTPHVAGVSVEGLASLCRTAVDGIADALA